MNDEIRLQELFDSFNPTLIDSDVFNHRLERKLAMIDEIRQSQAAQTHRYRMAVVAAFVVGVVLGGGLPALILSTPTGVPLFTFGIDFYPLHFIEQNSLLISVLMTSLMIAFFIVAMMNTSEMVNRIRGRKV